MLWNRMYLVWPSVWEYFAWLQLPRSQEMSLNYLSGSIYHQWGQGNLINLLRMESSSCRSASSHDWISSELQPYCQELDHSTDKESQLILHITFTADLRGAAGPLLTFSSLGLVLCLYFWGRFLMTNISYTNYNWELCRMTGIIWYLEHNFWSLLE